MGYATQQDLVDRFGVAELVYRTDRAAIPTGAPDPVAISRALADADAVIDDHLAVRYRLPLAGADPRLAKIACDLARYFYWGSDTEADQAVLLNYRDALSALGDLAAGRTALQQAAGARSPGGIGFNAEKRSFTLETLEDYL